MVKIPRRGAADPKPPRNSAPASNSALASAANPPEGRLRQIAMVAGIIRKNDPKALPVIIGSGVGVIVVAVLVGVFTGLLGLLLPLGILVGVGTTMILFGRYAQTAQYAAITGQPGAAAAIVQSMRGNWTVTPAVAGNRNLDIVHRVVGKPGVILLGEGAPNGLAPLFSAEKKRIARIAYGVPIIDLQVGDAPGQVPIKALRTKLMRMRTELKPPAVRDLNNRLKALPTTMQAPHGPVPKGSRTPRPPRPKVR